MKQEKWAELMEMLMTEAWEHKKFAINCKSGDHRANVTGRMLESALNSITISGERVFNCKHFMLGSSHAKSRKAVDTVIDEAVSWFKDAWCVMPTPDKLFGYEAATMSGEAFKSWTKINDLIIDWAKWTDPDAEHEGDTPPVGEAMAPWNEAASHVDDAIPKVGEATSHGVGASEHTNHGSEQAMSDEPPTKKPRMPPQEPPPQELLSQYAARASASASSSGTVAFDVPSWATFEQSAHAWYGLLKSHGVDDIATQSVFLLATHSHEGWLQANSILAKLCKKAGESANALSNPSGFVSRCVLNARNNIPSGWGH